MQRLSSTRCFVLASGACWLLACDQPKPRCSIARGDFAATYTLVASSGPCEPLRGEVLSVQAYTAPRSASDPRPDYDKTSVGIQPSALSALLAGAADRGAPDPSDQPFALGAFADSSPDSEDTCSVPLLSSARVRLPALAEQVEMCSTLPPEPAVDVSYAFSNLEVYVTAGAYGTQFSADLTLTRGECVDQYRVHAVYPTVSCAVELMDDGGEPLPDAGALPDGGALPDAGALLDARADSPSEDPHTMDGACPEEEPAAVLVADDSLCSPNGDPAMGRPYGSGINPDFAVQCDPELLLCVLSGTATTP